MPSGSVARILLTLGFVATAARECQCIKSKNYIKLIKDVHKLYQTSCVFFVQSDTFEDIKVTTLMHYWSLEFSKLGVLTMATSFPLIPDAVQNYVNRIGQPLYVITLNGQNTAEEFSNATAQIGALISRATWFVIFLEINGSRPYEEFCRNPTGNIFNLRFDTIMLVLCYDMPILREWYSLPANVTRTYDYAKWNPETTQLEILTRMNMHSRRDDMFNETLRVITLKTSTLLRIENNQLSGPFGVIFTELAKTLNFSIKILEPRETYGGWSESKKRWSGVIGQLANNEADIGLAGFSMSNRRLNAIDFGLPLIHTRSRVYIRRPDGAAVRWTAYFQAFDIRLWSTLLSVMTISPFVLTWMKRNLPAAGHKAKCNFTVMCESYTRVWGLYCQQGLTDFTTRDSLRVAYFVISVSSLIVYSAYSASLISFLTVYIPSMPFTTLDGFVKDGSYKLIVSKDSADYDMFNAAKDNILAEMMKLMKNESQLPLYPQDGFDQVCAGKVAFYTSEMLNQNTLHERKCYTVFIETGRVESISLVLAKHNPYTDLINYHLQKFLDNGIIDRITESQLKRTRNVEIVHPAVSVRGIAPIVAVAFGGFVLSLVLLGFEKLHFRRRERRRHREMNPCGALGKSPRGGRKSSRFSKQVRAIDARQTYVMEYLS